MQYGVGCGQFAFSAHMLLLRKLFLIRPIFLFFIGVSRNLELTIRGLPSHVLLVQPGPLFSQLLHHLSLVPTHGSMEWSPALIVGDVQIHTLLSQKEVDNLSVAVSSRHMELKRSRVDEGNEQEGGEIRGNKRIRTEKIEKEK